MYLNNVGINRYKQCIYNTLAVFDRNTVPNVNIIVRNFFSGMKKYERYWQVSKY